MSEPAPVATLPLRRQVSVGRRESVDASPRLGRASFDLPTSPAERQRTASALRSSVGPASQSTPSLSSSAKASRPIGASSHASSVLPSAGFFSPKKQVRPIRPPEPHSAGSDHSSFVAAPSTAPSTRALVPATEEIDMPEVHVRRQDISSADVRSPSVASTASHFVGAKPSREPLVAQPRNAPIPGSPSKSRTKAEPSYGDLEKVSHGPPARSDSFRSFRSVRDRRGRRMRNWQFHDGSNRFFLRGRLISSDDSMLYLLGSMTVAVVLPVLFLAFNAQWLWLDFPRADGQGGADGGSKFALILFVYLTLIMWASLLRTAFRDPGILPRDLHEADMERIACPLGADEDLGGGFAERPVARYIKVRDGVVTSKYCETCKVYRPPRSSHCRLCDDCVSRVDHHCVFLNTCVGERTYTSFLAFLVSTTFCILLAVGFSIAHTVLANTNAANGVRPLSTYQQIGSLIVAIAAFFLGLPVIGLLGYHVRLLWLGRTTIEMLRYRSVDSADRSMFSHGSHVADIIAAICRPSETYSFIAPNAYARRDVRLDAPADDKP